MIFTRSVELAAELLEPLVDLLADNEIIKEVPILGSAVKLATLGKTISGQNLSCKIATIPDSN